MFPNSKQCLLGMTAKLRSNNREARQMAQELVPAAKYIRMSTERQHYSSSNQNEVIEKFATRHAFGVVKTYSDEAKSGLSFRKRRGLQKLIEDVVGGLASYRAILIYNVSRWGRFQDI